jgi:16S rRNA (guanine527-N7)-methyltransferase
VDLAAIANSLSDFGLALEPRQVDQISKYTDLLLRWNRAINLTAIRDPQEMIVRHFAESMYLTRFVELRGNLLDVGSGAGFPGLALKIAQPGLSVVLLEPTVKKRAFLKEVVRECDLTGVEVDGAKVEDFCQLRGSQFNLATVRAVGQFGTVLSATAKCLDGSGGLYLWLTSREAQVLAESEPSFNQLFDWGAPIPVPRSRDREIWRGRLRAGTSNPNLGSSG